MGRLVSTDERIFSIRSSIRGGASWLKIGGVLLLVLLVGALAVVPLMPDKATPESSAYFQSSKVALITKSSGELSGAGNMPTSGTVAGLGSGFSFGQFTFTDVPLSSVTTSNLANYDTAVLLQVPTGSLSDANKQANNGFVTNGKKLIIYDSDATSGNDYSWLAAPAQTGVGCPNCGSRSGTATVLENNSMVSSDPSDQNHYINTDEVATQTDAVGDANVMLSQSSAWFVDIQATNSVGETGAVHTYASVGKGLIIYNGLDSDYVGSSSYSSSGVDWLGKLWFRELMQPWDPDDLPHQTPVDQPADRTKEDRGDNFGECHNGNQACIGEPVNAVTGNVYDVEEDLNLPGRGLPLEFERTYNSQADISATLGYGWTHSYNVLLLENPDGSVTELDPQGARLTFAKNADGSYTKPKGVHETLTKNADGTYVLRKQDGIEWRFGTDGTLQKLTDPNGYALTFSYGAEGPLTKITDDVGRDTTLAYNASGRIDTLTDPAGRVVRYGYSEVGDLTSVTDPVGNTTRYEYSAAHNLLKVIRPGDPFGSGNSGGTFAYTYDGQDRATSVAADNGNHKMTLDYHPTENRTLVTDSKGNTSEYQYDQDEQVTKIVDPYGKAIAYTWDARGNQTSVTDQLGNVTQMEYDGRDNLTKVIEPKPTATATVNPTTTLTYEPTFNRPTSVTDPEGGITRYEYDGKGNLTSMVDALGNKTTFEYDPFGQLVKTVNPRGNATTQDTADGIRTFTYSSNGNLTGITDPAAKKTTANYGVATTTTSVLGVPISVTGPLGRTTDFAYDKLGEMTKVTNPLTPPDTTRTTASMTYDAMGNPASVTDEKGHTTTYEHNPLGWLTKETTPDPDPTDATPAPTTTYNYDTEGNLTSETDPAGNTTTYGYDKLSRLTSVTRPDGTAAGVVTSYTYDDAGRNVSEKDANGNVRNYSYDSLDRLTKVSDLKADGTTLAAASYDYDLLGRMTKATNPNSNATSYSYDKIGHLTKATDPLGNSFSYAYDENGNVKSRTDAIGRVTNYTYDPLDRLTTKSYPDGSQIKGTYDAVGNLLSATDETGTYSYSYDERNRLTKETFPGGQVLQHGYDADSNRTSLTYPDGAKAFFEYDAADRLTAVTDRAGAKSTYAYDSRDLPTKVSYPNGTGNAYTYDALGRVTQAKATGTNSTGGTTILASLSYAYDKNSNPTSITDKAGNQSTFTYDALDRLTKEIHPDRTLSYAYDAAGNRTSLTRRTSSTSNGTTIWTTHLINYAYDAAERMMYAGSTTYAYDKNGNMTSTTAGTQTTGYSYDYEDALTKAGTKTYGRDPFERAVSSTAGKTTTNYLFDGPEAVQQKTGTATTHYTRGLGGQLINRRSGNTSPSYYHHDAIGSVVGLTDSTGALTDAYAYTAFGEMRSRTGTSAQPYQYLGNFYDPDSKLYDFHAGTYDPAVGRFTTKDPIGGMASKSQTLDPYSCSMNNPLTYPDPYGLFAASTAGGDFSDVPDGT